MANRIVFGLKLFAGGAMLGAFGSVLPAQSPVQGTASYMPVGSSVAMVTRSDLAQGTITGRVTDGQSGQPLADVALTVQGTQLGGTTGRDGTYRIVNVPPGAHTIIARRIGYTAGNKTVTVTNDGTATLDFTLEPTAINLQEVVVSGTVGNQTRAAQSAVVSTINTADVVQKAPVANVTDVLEARVPGLVVSSASGTLGAASRIQIRGAASISLSNEPLVFIDGIRMTSGQLGPPGGVGGQVLSALNDINPDDIESIEVVKGPAAATLYGSDASAGVIQIITKKGRLGAKHFTQNLSGEYGSVNRNFTTYPVYAICTAQYVALGNAVPGCVGQTAGAVISDNPLERLGAFHNGHTSSFNYNGQGGGDNYSYFVSGGFDNDEGTTANTYHKRRSGRASLTWVATPQLGLDASFAMSQNNYKLPRGDQDNYGYLINDYFTNPLLLTPAPGGGFTGDLGGFPLAAIQNILSEENSLRMTPSLTVRYNPFSWMTNRLTLGADVNDLRGLAFYPKNDNGWYPSAANGQDLGHVDVNQSNVNVYSVDYLGNIKTSLFGNENITSNLSFGSQYINTVSNGLNGSGSGLVINEANLLSQTASPTGGQSFSQSKQLGFLAQEQIGFNDRLFIQFAGRLDRSSAFSGKAQNFFLPKVGASYVISDEPFWKNRFGSVIPTLRFRAAYGTTGRWPSSTAALRTYAQFPYVTDAGVVETGAILSNPGNDNLKPERGTEFEGGFDSGFLDDRVGLDVTYFNKVTKDLLLLVPIAPSLGFGSNPYDNLGKVSNKGVEFTLRATPIRRDNFTWDAVLSGATLKNEVLEMGGLAPIIASNRIITPGQPIASWYSYKIRSIDTQNGVVTVSDTNEYDGNQLPTFTGNVNTTVTLFKNLRLYALFDMKRGYKVWNFDQMYLDRTFQNSAGVNLPADQGGYSDADRLRRLGPYVSESGAPIVRDAVVDPYLEDGSFVRFREFSATLSLPAGFAQKFGASGASITLGGRNLHLWSNFSGYDPEVIGTGPGAGDSQFTQFFNVSLFTLPPTRTWIGRINFQF